MDRLKHHQRQAAIGVRPQSPTVLSRTRIRCWPAGFQAAGAGVTAAYLRNSSAPQTMNGNGISSSRPRTGATAVPSSAWWSELSGTLDSGTEI